MKRWEKVAWWLLGLAAVVSRFLFLGERVPHHDEAVHAHLARELLLLGKYQYDPTYHGPLQFYVMAPLMAVFGQNDFVVRIWAAVCGVGLVLAPALLRKRVGGSGALGMGVLMLFSPTLTYYSRFAREDAPVIFFTFAAAALLLAGQRHRRYALFPVAVLAALHLASKETFYVYLVVLAVAWCATWIRRPSYAWTTLQPWLKQNQTNLLAAFFLFLAVTLTLYTFFFRHPEDILFPVKAVVYWWGQHAQERVAGPAWYYLPRLALYEFAILGLAAGFYWQRRRRISATWRFFFFWGLVSLAMYAYLGEKVPWLALHQILPFLPPAGIALGRLVSRGAWRARMGVLVLFAATAWNTVQACFVNSAIEPSTGKAELLVYVQTVPSFKAIIEEGKQLAAQSGDELAIAVAGEAGWPLAWSWANIPVWWDTPKEGQNIRLFLCDPGREQEIVNTLGKGFGCGEIPLRAWWAEEGPFTLRGVTTWFFTRQAWSPVGFQSVTVCRILPEPPAGSSAP
ncbi:hypothetical protein EG19_10210 [Thermoanaerobaculum aquaticum]|uniref:Glycosyltransferase RgtA/B/C/D-like domain-containing protein n=1 Tax=Thermoanaerobaculum aquaticum TaxID=1312852 RepID=A0A062Y295_9BACT|nr:flippase activity-associated protein Agl23 [Thermoanaerobaculum aquaticum]KDA54531.1 hypothetical protein EG19_10210 [Thermoanaerobaculum aquaticum]